MTYSRFAIRLANILVTKLLLRSTKDSGICDTKRLCILISLVLGGTDFGCVLGNPLLNLCLDIQVLRSVVGFVEVGTQTIQLCSQLAKRVFDARVRVAVSIVGASNTPDSLRLFPAVVRLVPVAQSGIASAFLPIG